MSVPYVSLLNAIHQLVDDRQCAVDVLGTKHNTYKAHVAHIKILECAIAHNDLPIIDELKSMFINGNTNVSTAALIPLIKAKYEANKDVSNSKMLERDIIIDMHEYLRTLTTVGRNQLLILLTRSVLRHTNEKVYSLIMFWN